MLVLSLKNKERIHIADNIVITILEIATNKIRVGVVAPPDIPVHRGKVYETIQRQKGKKLEKKPKKGDR